MGSPGSDRMDIDNDNDIEEAVSRELEEVSSLLSSGGRWGDTENISWRWRWKDENIFKERFYNRWSHWEGREHFAKFGVSLSGEMKDLWTRDSVKNTAIALYKYLLIPATAFATQTFASDTSASGKTWSDSQDRAFLLILSWELYYDKPSEYSQMLKLARSQSSTPQVMTLPPSQSTQAENKPWGRFNPKLPMIYRFLDCRQGDTLAVKAFCQDVGEREEEDPGFKKYLHFLETLSEFDLYAISHFELSPTMFGMNKAARDTIDEYLSTVEKKIAQFLETDDESPSGQSEVQLKTIFKEYPDHVLLLYGVSGSGKTTAIKHLLQEKWGYYLMPGNLNLSPQFNLHRREEYSKDSRFLWNLVETIDDILPGMGNNPHQTPIKMWSDRLILSRRLIFDRFLRAAAEKPSVPTPAKWFQFQTSYSATFDPFEPLFKLLLLVSSRHTDLGFEMPYLAKLHRQQPFYCCLDEAQRYLDTRIPTNISGYYRVDNLLQQTLNNPLSWSKFQHGEMRFVVSGTSLKLQETISTIVKIKQRQRRASGPTPTKCRTITDLPLLTSDEHFEKLVNKHGLLKKIKLWASPENQDFVSRLRSWASPKYKRDVHPKVNSRASVDDPQEFFRIVLDTVMKCGVPLRGRYLWSARYVDSLMILFSPDSSSKSVVVDEGAVLKVASETGEEGKNHLKKRLRQLRDGKHEEILKELCWVVIQSDLLDKPTNFEKDRDHQMISEAFAVVETHGDSLKGTLKETLAMDAAKEWFREESQDVYYGKFNEYLRFLKHDPSSFGKATEWFLALELFNCLRRSNRMAGSGGEERRVQVLRMLSDDSEDREQRSEGSPKQQPLNPTYRLVEGKNIGYAYNRTSSFDSSGENRNFGSRVSIGKWMKSIRERDREGDKPIASFYFPDNYCGPDIVFCLAPEKSSITDLVLCVLQLKTGPIQTSNIGKVIKTTNLARSYESFGTCKKEYDELQFELKEWKAATIIQILVDTAKDHKEDDVVNLWKKEQKKKKTQCRELFLLCDKGRTEDLFGETFAALVDARKSVNELAEAEKSQTPGQAEIDGKREEVGTKFQSAIETRAQRGKSVNKLTKEEKSQTPVQAREEVGIETRAQKRKRLEELPVRNKRKREQKDQGGQR